MLAVRGGILLVVAVCLSLVAAQANDTPELNVQTTFPNNPFSRAANGQGNRVVFTVSQPKSGADADRLLTLESITGAFLNRDKVGKRGYVMRNVSLGAAGLPAYGRRLRLPMCNAPF